MRKRLGIIGHFGGGNDFFDGQTVKTKVLYQELSERGFNNIFCVDTYYNKTNKIRLLWDTLLCFLKCETIIVLLSQNGLKIYLPMLYLAKKFLKRKIYHDVVGGHLHEDIEGDGKMIKYLSALDGNWVETNYMKKALEDKGIDNCRIVTNFKTLSGDKAIKEATDEGKYRFCIFSRVMEEKGVTDAIEAISKYNSCHDKKVHLNIWGSVDESYKDTFDALLEKNSDSVTYGGRVDFDKSVETLTDHAALLFPTKFAGEGCPGTIIDAYTAALPVISSQWNAAGEMVKDFETGWVYPNEKVKNLYESIEWAVENADHMTSMRRNCTLIAKHYSADYVMDRIIREIK